MQESGDETMTMQKVAELDTRRETRDSKSQTDICTSAKSFMGEANARVSRMGSMGIEEGSALCTNDRIAARETQSRRVGLDLPLNSFRKIWAVVG